MNEWTKGRMNRCKDECGITAQLRNPFPPTERYAGRPEQGSTVGTRQVAACPSARSAGLTGYGLCV